MNASRCCCSRAKFHPFALLLVACAVAHAAPSGAGVDAGADLFTTEPALEPDNPSSTQDTISFALWVQSASDRPPLPGSGLTARSERLQLFGDLFTPAEYSFLSTASNIASATRAGMRQNPGATTGSAYAGAISTALVFDASPDADDWPALTSWGANGARLGTRLTSQLIPMTLDFTRRNPFYNSGGNASSTLYWLERTFVILPMPHGSRSMRLGGNGLRLATLEIIAGDQRRQPDGNDDLGAFCKLWLTRAANVTFAELLNAGLSHQPAPLPGRAVAVRTRPQFPFSLSYSY